MSILALDPATKCGWAHDSGASGVWDLSVRRDESSGMRLIRFRSHLNTVHQAYPLKVIAFEAARGGNPRRMGALVVSGELQGVIKVFCEEHGVEFKGFSPSEIKKHATGKGNANKALMMDAARRKWPDVPLIDDNHADALHILDLYQSTLSS